MTLFSQTSHASYNATPSEKREALTLDFLQAGKTIDWVLTQVCGSDNKAIAHIIVFAQQKQFITAEQRKGLLSKFKIDETGRKVKK